MQINLKLKKKGKKRVVEFQTLRAQAKKEGKRELREVEEDKKVQAVHEEENKPELSMRRRIGQISKASELRL